MSERERPNQRRDEEARQRRLARDGDALTARYERDAAAMERRNAKVQKVQVKDDKPKAAAEIDRIAQLEKTVLDLQALLSNKRPVSELILARKGASNLQFTELTIPDSGTTLSTITAGGRSCTSDSAPMAPFDLGQDDWVLLEVPTRNQVRTVRISGAAIKDIRYNTTTHNLQVTYKTAPAESDWLNRVQFDSCTAARLDDSAGTTPRENRPTGLLSSEFRQAESEGIGSSVVPLTGYASQGLGV